MKTLNKIENIIVTIFLGLFILITMIIGAYELFYNGFDMYSDQATWLTIIYGIVSTYWIIKKIVFRTIAIIKR